MISIDKIQQVVSVYTDGDNFHWNYDDEGGASSLDCVANQRLRVDGADIPAIIFCGLARANGHDISDIGDCFKFDWTPVEEMQFVRGMLRRYDNLCVRAIEDARKLDIKEMEPGVRVFVTVFYACVKELNAIALRKEATQYKTTKYKYHEG